MFETRANELDKKRRSISDFKNSQSLRTASALNDFKRSESDKHLSPAFKLMSARSSFNEVPNYENLGTTKSIKLAKTQQKAQKLFKNCSEYLNQRHAKESLHKDIDSYDKFLGKVKAVFKDGKPPPIVLRSQDGLQEEQRAIYQMRAQHENKYYMQTINYEEERSKTSKGNNRPGKQITSKHSYQQNEKLGET